MVKEVMTGFAQIDSEGLVVPAIRDVALVLDFLQRKVQASALSEVQGPHSS